MFYPENALGLSNATVWISKSTAFQLGVVCGFIGTVNQTKDGPVSVACNATVPGARYGTYTGPCIYRLAKGIALQKLTVLQTVTALQKVFGPKWR